MKHIKLTSKKLLVVTLAMILVVSCFCTATFSWLPRPKSTTGKELAVNIPQSEFYLNSANLTTGNPIAYDGSDVTMKTYVSNDDGVSFSQSEVNPATSKTNLGTSSPSNRVYYKTSIINGSTTPQNVSLYIKNFTPNGDNICVGTNVPVKSFKNYSKYGVSIPSPSKNKTNGKTKRVYFEPVGRVPSGNAYNDHRTTWANKTYYVCSGGSSTDIDANNGSAGTYTEMMKTPYSDSAIYYADIPWDHNKLFFSVKDWNGANYKRTQTFTNLSGDGLSMTQSLLFYTNGSYTDYNNAWAGKEACVGANFASYYTDISLAGMSGQSISVALDASDYQSNKGVTYTSLDTSVFTVNNAGVITPSTSLTANKTAKLSYTVTSYYGDTMTKEVNVTVKAVNSSTATIKNAPIVTNLLIPAATSQGNVNADNSNVQDVYWFIQNGDAMYGEATPNASYKLDGIYLGV